MCCKSAVIKCSDRWLYGFTSWCIRHHLRGFFCLPVQSRIASSCRKRYLITSLITLSGCRLNKAIGFFAGKPTPSLRARLSLSPDLAFVVTAHPESLLFGVPWRVFPTATRVFIPINCFLQRHALSSINLPTILCFYLLLFLFFPKVYRPLSIRTRSLPLKTAW